MLFLQQLRYFECYTTNNIQLRKQLMKKLVLTCLLGLMSVAYAAPVVNFGQNLNSLKAAYANRSVHILQIGDSHTAGDYFTEKLRKRLQAELGDGGLGFVYPVYLTNQRNARHGYGSSWQSFNSRSNEGLDYPLGGVYAVSDGISTLTITSQYYNNTAQNARLVVKGKAGQTITVSSKSATLAHTGWQVVNTPIRFPFSITADSGVTIGGAWLSKGVGGIVSSMGINGATQSYWQRWHNTLSQDLSVSSADLVILAYGTNEAFSQDPSAQESAIKYAIAQIRAGLPNAAILLINAPDSLKGVSSCSAPTYLSQARATIERVARQYGTLYWDWQQMMGGGCSMKSWIEQGLAAKDGIHFNRQGYELAADDLYSNLKSLLANPNQQSSGSQSTINQNGYQTPPLKSSPSANWSNRQTQPAPAVGRICGADGKCLNL